jgi:hypothetical protein
MIPPSLLPTSFQFISTPYCVYHQDSFKPLSLYMEGLHLGASCCHLFPASLIEPLYSFSFCSTPILAILSFPLRMHSTLDKLTASYGSEVSLRNHARVEESPSLESHTEVGTWYQKNRLLFLWQ